MDLGLGIVIGLVLGAVVGLAVGLLIANSKNAGLREAGAQASVYKEQLEKREAELAKITEQKDSEKEQESKILERLAPVSKSLADMQKTISDLEQQRQRQHTFLEETLGQLHATTSSLAGTLTKSQERGRWGEVQLEQIFESAGLIETVHFEKQATSAAASAGTSAGTDSRIRPDFILNLPNGRVVPIDAKVPFDSFDRAMEIPLNSSRDDLIRRDGYLKAHAKALRDHVKILASKQYGESLSGAPDFVVAFLPAEAILSAALEADPQLMNDSFSQRVALSSPVVLWSIVKSIAYSWQQQEASNSAQEIVDVGKALLDRVAVLARHSTKLGSNLEKTVKSYNEFASSLERNLLTQAQRLQKLDISKELPSPEQIDTTPHAFTKPELTDTVD